jgi:DNA-binding transcriptional ArsR family regulator
LSMRVRPLKYLLGWLIAGSRGGLTRAKIIEELRENPQNANQLANSLGMDYRTIRHHLKLLQKNRN